MTSQVYRKMEPTSAASPGANAKVLSCTSCRTRKIKCNKSNPCIPCQQSGTKCVFPQRAKNRRPRLGSKARDQELLKRISQLENIVKSIDPAKLTPEPASPAPSHKLRANTPPNQKNEADPPKDNQAVWLEKNFAHFKRRQEDRAVALKDGFWTTLHGEFAGIRELLEEPDDEDSDGYDDGTNVTNASTSHFSMGSPATYLDAGFDIAKFYPSPLHRERLVITYWNNVHPVCRMLHKVTAIVHFKAWDDFIDPSTGRWKFASLECLTFVIFFAAVTSIDDEQCLIQYGEHRDVLVARYRRCAEVAFSQADFLNTMEQVLVQAFVLYLTILRSHDKSRSTWTLIGLAIRMAHAAGFHRDGDGNQFIAFEANMRRRIWWQLVVLDVRASEDRGLESMIQDGSFNTRMPANLNDEETSFTSVHPLVGRESISDMCFTLITMDVANTYLKINYAPPSTDRTILTMQQKEELVKDCSNRINNIYLVGADLSNPQHWLTSMMGRFLTLKLWLVLQYPLQSRKRATTDDEAPQFPYRRCLQTAVTYMQLNNTILQDQRAKPFLWLFQTIVPWHALAVALAELCTETTGQTADEAWSIINKNYDKWADDMADSQDGVLWKPIRRLFKKAREARERALTAEIESMSLQREEAQTQQQVDGYPIGAQRQGSGAQAGPHAEQSPQDYTYAPQQFARPAYADYPIEYQASPHSQDTSIPVPSMIPTSQRYDEWNSFVFDVGVGEAGGGLAAQQFVGGQSMSGVLSVPPSAGYDTHMYTMGAPTTQAEMVAATQQPAYTYPAVYEGVPEVPDQYWQYRR